MDAPQPTTPLKRDGLSGIEYVRAMADGRIPLSGMARTIGWDQTKKLMHKEKEEEQDSADASADAVAPEGAGGT